MSTDTKLWLIITTLLILVANDFLHMALYHGWRPW